MVYLQLRAPRSARMRLLCSHTAAKDDSSLPCSTLESLAFLASNARYFVCSIFLGVHREGELRLSS
jgi:hypothetical protein